jgi:metal-sulfur cluster biosynthetic enzyme
MIQENITQEEVKVYEILKQVPDPEVGVNIVDLGLIYKVVKNDEVNTLDVDVTLSTPGCPVGDTIIQHIQTILEVNYPAYTVSVDLVWEPQWNPEMISEEGLQELKG